MKYILTINNMDPIIKQITFIQEPFKYEVEFDETNNILCIKATHNIEFLMWKIIIDDVISEKTSKYMSVELEPEAIFQILENHAKGTLGSDCKLILQDAYKQHDVPIVVEIITTLSYNKKYHDSKFIQLMPEKISDDKRFDLKLNHLKNEIYLKYDLQHNELNEKTSTYKQKDIENLKKEIENLKEEIKDLKNSYANNINNNSHNIRELALKVNATNPLIQLNIDHLNKTSKINTDNITVIQSQLTQLTLTNQNLNDKITSLQSQLTDLKLDIEHLNKTSKINNDGIYTVQSQLANQKLDIENLNKTSKINTDNITSLQSRLANQKLDLDIENLNKTSKINTDNITSLQTQLANQKLDIDTLKNNLS
jgi:hypothetical protein